MMSFSFARRVIGLLFVISLPWNLSANGSFPSSPSFVSAFVTNTPRSIRKKFVDNSSTSGRRRWKTRQHSLVPMTDRLFMSLLSATSSAATTSNGDGDAVNNDPAATDSGKRNKKSWKELRKEGGPFTLNTPIGALNPFALYYFFVSVGLGIPWFFICKFLQMMYWITGNRFDKQRRIPIFFGHCWGMTLMRLTRCYPVIKNREIVSEFFKNGKDQKAMFVANHCSWMDIPFLGATMGWRNYKIIAKKELGIVPILGAAIRVGGHIMVARDDRRSQIKTLKQGINCLKDGVNLATFPEGTRSRSGRLMDFKAGAFKMAHKAGAPVFPISIISSEKVMPLGWMMAMRPAYGLAEVIVHPPISSTDKTEEELTNAVRKSMIDGLPDYQKPL